MRELLFLLLLLACPLAMLFMMRGGHAHGGHSHTAHASGSSDQPPSISELRQRRAELDRLIGTRAGGSACRVGVDVPASHE